MLSQEVKRRPKPAFKKRRRAAYKGIVNQEPVKAPLEPMLFNAYDVKINNEII
jgi:hypothetical protein